jgi:sigma-B regulation protein RsbU (phosphoserine phosphatase)
MTSRLSETKTGDILIVDDTPANLRLLTSILADEGYNPRPVPNGPLALQAAAGRQPDLILLDIRMPGMNGYEVGMELKDNPSTSEIPIIFISALGSIEDKVKAFQVGGVDYITKPFHAEEVLARVETHLSLRRLQKQQQEINRKMARELRLAGEIQASFLPQELPEIPGWQFSAILEPARETSGDFYDIRETTSGQLALLVADVVDKGAGAAMFMALCTTLLRSYGSIYPFRPDQVLNAVNARILTDTGGQQFVSVFYGCLNAGSGELVYCNAGHPPPLCIRAADSTPWQRLTRTGTALGISEDSKWETGKIQFSREDLLLLYTDGLTDAENRRGEFFGEQAIIDSLVKNCSQHVLEIHRSLLAEVGNFVGDAPQHDDIALIFVKRDRED